MDNHHVKRVSSTYPGNKRPSSTPLMMTYNKGSQRITQFPEIEVSSDDIKNFDENSDNSATLGFIENDNDDSGAGPSNNKNCNCGPNLYGKILGKTPDESILSAWITMMDVFKHFTDKCPPEDQAEEKHRPHIAFRPQRESVDVGVGEEEKAQKNTPLNSEPEKEPEKPKKLTSESKLIQTDTQKEKEAPKPQKPVIKKSPSADMATQVFGRSRLNDSDAKIQTLRKETRTIKSQTLTNLQSGGFQVAPKMSQNMSQTQQPELQSRPLQTDPMEPDPPPESKPSSTQTTQQCMATKQSQVSMASPRRLSPIREDCKPKPIVCCCKKMDEHYCISPKEPPQQLCKCCECSSSSVSEPRKSEKRKSKECCCRPSSGKKICRCCGKLNTNMARGDTVQNARARCVMRFVESPNLRISRRTRC